MKGTSADPGRETSTPVRVRGVELCVRSEGQGTPVLLLHGFSQSGESLSELSAGLRDRHRCLRVDVVGHGRSSAPHELARYTMPAATGLFPVGPFRSRAP